MSKYDDFDLDLTNTKSQISPMKWTDVPTDITCPEDGCYPTMKYLCGTDRVCIN